MWQQLLGHVASLERFLPRGHTRMHPLQWQFKDHWSPMVDDPAGQILFVACVHRGGTVVAPGGQVAVGVPLQAPSPSYTDSSLSGWGAHLLDLMASEVWSEEETQEYINVLEMGTVPLAPAAFLPQLSGQSVILMSIGASVVAYLQHQGGMVSQTLFLMASEITWWTKQHSVQLVASYILKRKTILSDQLSRPNQVLTTEWSLLPQVSEGVCSIFGRPHLNLFATQANMKLQLYMSPVPDPLAWKQNAVQHPQGNPYACAFPPFALLRQVFS